MAEAEAKKPEKESPETKGWLYKWTNYIKGYQKRWFVLQNGLLSYYRYIRNSDYYIVIEAFCLATQIKKLFETLI